ncbi:MAG: ATP-binding protein [Nitrospirae bacterium]|nr:ATP-binding protein [Nitrospirota bacterium]MCL5977542.1 ATP-binding protein [Nitrospirota bacterium]
MTKDNLIPIKIVLIYAIVGALWIFLSDSLLAKAIKDHETLTWFQTYKEWLYVAVTAVVLHRLISGYTEKLYRSSEEAKSSEGKICVLNEELEHRVLELEKSQAELKRHEEDQRRLEEQLRHAQKMEAVGTLAGGVAHDFNNILTTIIGYANLLQMKMREDDPGNPYIKEVLVSAEKAAHLVNSLLAFSRKQIMSLKPVNVNDIIIGMKKMLARLISEDIEFRVDAADKELTVMADRGQIEQVLMNLVTNARDAMPDGGILTIETGLAELDENYMKAHEYGKPGMYAFVSVSDTGAGMDEKTKEKIFEPFFTTKEVGKGTGLGLATTYGSIRQHNGYISVYSEPGKGTTFMIYLPLIGRNAEMQSEERIKTAEIKGGSETILAAEDDVEVRKLAKKVLEKFGYKIIEAVDGEDAVSKFMDNKDTVRLLLFDVIMPKKDGKAAYEEIKKINPGIKTIFMSGYTADIIHKKGVFEGGIEFISKPVPPDVLLKKVRESLDKE